MQHVQIARQLGGGAGQMGVEKLIVLIVLFVARGRRRGLYHAGAAAHSDAKRQARPRPARLWRHAAVPAAAGQSGRRDADHFRQQLADVPDAAVHVRLASLKPD